MGDWIWDIEQFISRSQAPIQARSGASLRVSFGRSWVWQHPRCLCCTCVVSTGRAWVCRAARPLSPTTKPSNEGGTYCFFPCSQMRALQHFQGDKWYDPVPSQPVWASPGQHRGCIRIWPLGTLLLEEAECSGMGCVQVVPSPALQSLYSPPASQKGNIELCLLLIR